MSFKQGQQSATKYLLEFHTLATGSRWIKPPLISVFHQRQRGNVIIKLACRLSLDPSSVWPVAQTSSSTLSLLFVPASINSEIPAASEPMQISHIDLIIKKKSEDSGKRLLMWGTSSQTQFQEGLTFWSVCSVLFLQNKSIFPSWSIFQILISDNDF